MTAATATNRCRPISEWPLADQTAWTAALAPGRLVAQWSEGTRSLVTKGYGRWLTWLDQQGLLDPALLPADRLTTDRLASYMADLRNAVGESTVARRVEQLGNALRAMAPERDWHWLQRMAISIHTAAKADREADEASISGRSPEDVPPDTGARLNRSRKLDKWPALDQAAWMAALQPGDVLDPGGVAARWAIATRGLVADGYGHWLTWLDRQGALDPLLPPAARVTRARLLAYAEHLTATVAAFTVAARIEQVGNAMRALEPRQDWRWIQRAADRLRAQAVSVRDKRARLQSPDHLVTLGMTLMQDAEDPARGRPADRASAYRDGLLIALLALRPMRRRNLKAILCDQHLVRRGAEWWLVFAAAETKTRQPLEFPFPADLMPGLQRYLEGTGRSCWRVASGERRRSPPCGCRGTALTWAKPPSLIRFAIAPRSRWVDR